MMGQPRVMPQLERRRRIVLKNRGGRPKVFTDKILAQIPTWVAEGWSLVAIAERIGTTPGSLYVTCSKLGIPLKDARRPMAKRSAELTVLLSNPLSTKLDNKARDMAMSSEHLVAVLLEQIVGDDLFNAILDFDGK